MSVAVRSPVTVNYVLNFKYFLAYYSGSVFKTLDACGLPVLESDATFSSSLQRVKQVRIQKFIELNVSRFVLPNRF